MSGGHRPVAAVVAGLAHIASGCLTIAIAAGIAYAGFFSIDPSAADFGQELDFFPFDPAVDVYWAQLNFGPGGGLSGDVPGFLFDGPAFLVLSLVVALCVAALGIQEVRIGRRALRGTGYFAAISFGIAWAVLSLGLPNYPGFLLAGTAAVSVWMARGWFREVDFAARDQVWGTPHHFKDWTLPDTPVAQAPSASDPDEPGVRPD